MAAAAGAPTVPSTRTAAKRSLFGCQTPFKCIHIVDEATPTGLSDGQVLVAVHGSSVNPCDVDYIELGIGCNGGKDALGMDLAGTVVAVGPGCTRLKIGSEVWADGGGTKGFTGSMAQYVVADEAATGIKPPTLNFTEAGTLPLVGLTSLEMLQKTGAPWSKPNLTVAITSGSGGTGFVAVQLAKRAFGAGRVITAASGAANIALMKTLGADVVIDYKVSDIFAALPDNSVDIVIDNYGAKGEADRAMPKIRSGGTYLLLPGGGGGTLSKHPKQGVTQINFGYTSSSDHKQLDLLAGYVAAGELQPHVFQRFQLKDAAQAFALSKTGGVVGKVAVTV